jgi:hypothetical protein
VDLVHLVGGGGRHHGAPVTSKGRSVSLGAFATMALAGNETYNAVLLGYGRLLAPLFGSCKILKC